MYNEYIRKISESFIKGDAREESYYPALSEMLTTYADNQKRKISVTILPKKTEAGNPDFRIWDGLSHITGYVEAKDPSVCDLNQIERSEQLKRYISTFPNVILTNFHEFRLYREGILIKTVNLFRSNTLLNLRTTPKAENIEAMNELLDKYFSFTLPRITNAEDLAKELAKRTRFLKDEVISLELKEETQEQKRKKILPFYDAFKKYLIKDLSIEDFADLYAQTLTYGLFAARTRATDTFNRELAYRYIPQTIGILKDIFRFISMDDLPEQLKTIIEDISEILESTDIKKILRQYQIEKKGDDPIIHFYETFLGIYDEKVRKTRGVYYTPEPVVSYIVRAVNSLLKSHFNKALGFCDEAVTILDPAAGTLTFPAEAIKLMVNEYRENYGDATIHQLIKDKILKNIFAFELMMAPYAIGHLKMSFIFEELNYQMAEDERFNLYLTNALEMTDLKGESLPGLASLSEESHDALKIKKDEKILVMMGNPPYSGHSANKGEWIDNALKTDINGAQSYYTIDGLDLNERNSKWLQDDYVKFIRLAQWKIQSAGEGIVAMITNHGYLDNPTFRGMRQSLMKTFNEIYIIDLHGNSKKKEKSPDGTNDENVFDIQQGVAIALFIKQKDKTGCRVWHQDIYGKRTDKYQTLLHQTFSRDTFKEITPQSDKYFFVPFDVEHISYYLKWPSLNDIFKINSVGIVTGRDKLTIQENRKRMYDTVVNFTCSENEFARMVWNLGKDSSDWSIDNAKKDILNTKYYEKYIYPIAYRPFDNRYTFYTGKPKGFITRSRYDVMKHMLKENIGLISVRQVAETSFNHAFVTDALMESRMTLSNKGIAYLFPLYLYPDEDSFEETRQTNFKPEFLQFLKDLYKIVPEPETVMGYIYAILYSDQYRSKFADFLRTDFPRIPFIEDYEQFMKLSDKGLDLIN
ncbi:MAG TPA: N-6 DNA methylase, partial [Candidatus Cloacimonadota bacterium]|nr:N-6 DNA methylase [Candidatus Cloacimonadota bacterium]